jgi:magnesium transporter
VVTATEHEDDTFGPVRERARRASGRIRERGPDYLGYAVLDLGIDSYFPIVEAAGDRLEALEDLILDDPSSVPVGELQRLRRALISLRRSAWPLREVVNVLLRGESPLIAEQTRVYLRDCHDHAIEVIELVESSRDVASGLSELLMSSVGNRMNEIMKVLTIIGTIFIPLGFIAGLYGMNFDRTVSPWNMPETGWYWGYPAALALMAGVAGVMIGYFVRRGWIVLGRRRGAGEDRERHEEASR